MTFVVVFVIALGTALVATPGVARLAARHGFAYAGRVQDLHQRPTPRLGGLALYVAFGLAVATSLVLPVERRDPLELQRLKGVLLGATVVLFLGVLDDRRPLSSLPQIAGLTLAAACPIALGVRIETIANPFGGTPPQFPLWFAVPFTLFWIMGAANTVNWLDGLDGLAAGVSAIGAVAFTAHSLRIGQASIALLPLAMAGACLGFLRYNFYPARIFLGGGPTFWATCWARCPSSAGLRGPRCCWCWAFRFWTWPGRSCGAGVPGARRPTPSAGICTIVCSLWGSRSRGWCGSTTCSQWSSASWPSACPAVATSWWPWRGWWSCCWRCWPSSPGAGRATW